MRNNQYDIEFIVSQVEKKINETLKANLYEAGLRDDELERLKNRKNELRKALNNCGVGDTYAKRYIKDLISDMMDNYFVYTENSYDRIIPFEQRRRMSLRDIFDILMHIYSQEYGEAAFEHFVEKSGVMEHMEEEMGCSIDGEMLEEIYDRENVSLTEKDKKEIIVQRIYSMYRGLGVVDDIRDMRLDGVSAGVSGVTGGIDSVWVFFRGVNLHMSFLSYGSEEELRRVCMNIYRFGNPGQLSRAKGYIIGEMADGSRVVVVRPPFSESYAFFVRKFDNIQDKRLEELITDDNASLPIEIIGYMVKGCQITAITGAQGSGKTTLLMSLIKYIPPMYSLRIQESAFELHLRNIYPDRNILTFRETDNIDGQTGLDVQKKTDGAVNILGEVATIQVAAYMIQMSQTGSIFTLFTHHAKSTDSLIKYLRNSLLSCGLFRDERIATEQVADAVRFDIHMEKDIYGHRYIERISEIVEDESRRGYHIQDIVVYEEGKYVRKSGFSEKTEKLIMKHLNRKERAEFCEKYCIQV